MVSIGEETYRVLCKLLMVAMIGWQAGVPLYNGPGKTERVPIGPMGECIPNNIISKLFKILFLYIYFNIPSYNCCRPIVETKVRDNDLGPCLRMMESRMRNIDRSPVLDSSAQRPLSQPRHPTTAGRICRLFRGWRRR